MKERQLVAWWLSAFKCKPTKTKEENKWHFNIPFGPEGNNKSIYVNMYFNDRGLVTDIEYYLQDVYSAFGTKFGSYLDFLAAYTRKATWDTIQKSSTGVYYIHSDVSKNHLDDFESSGLQNLRCVKLALAEVIGVKDAYPLTPSSIRSWIIDGIRKTRKKCKIFGILCTLTVVGIPVGLGFYFAHKHYDSVASKVNRQKVHFKAPRQSQRGAAAAKNRITPAAEAPKPAPKPAPTPTPAAGGWKPFQPAADLMRLCFDKNTVWDYSYSLAKPTDTQEYKDLVAKIPELRKSGQVGKAIDYMLIILQTKAKLEGHATIGWSTSEEIKRCLIGAGYIRSAFQFLFLGWSRFKANPDNGARFSNSDKGNQMLTHACAFLGAMFKHYGVTNAEGFKYTAKTRNIFDNLAKTMTESNYTMAGETDWEKGRAEAVMGQPCDNLIEAEKILRTSQHMTGYWTLGLGLANGLDK